MGGLILLSAFGLPRGGGFLFVWFLFVRVYLADVIHNSYEVQKKRFETRPVEGHQCRGSFTRWLLFAQALFVVVSL